MPGSGKNAQHVWYYVEQSLIGTEKEKGPIDEEQLMQLARKNLLRLKTRLRSPTRTDDQWVYAETILKLALTINKAEIDASDPIGETKEPDLDSESED